MKQFHFGSYLANGGGGSDTRFHIHSASMTSDDKGNAFFDGTRVGNVDSTSAHNNNYLPRQIQFGGWQISSEFSKGEVAEFIAFDRVLLMMLEIDLIHSIPLQ